MFYREIIFTCYLNASVTVQPVFFFFVSFLILSPFFCFCKIIIFFLNVFHPVFSGWVFSPVFPVWLMNHRMWQVFPPLWMRHIQKARCPRQKHGRKEWKKGGRSQIICGEVELCECLWHPEPLNCCARVHWFPSKYVLKKGEREREGARDTFYLFLPDTDKCTTDIVLGATSRWCLWLRRGAFLSLSAWYKCQALGPEP